MIYQQNYCLTSICHEIPSLKAIVFLTLCCDIFSVFPPTCGGPLAIWVPANEIQPLTFGWQLARGLPSVIQWGCRVGSVDTAEGERAQWRDAHICTWCSMQFSGTPFGSWVQHSEPLAKQFYRDYFTKLCICTVLPLNGFVECKFFLVHRVWSVKFWHQFYILPYIFKWKISLCAILLPWNFPHD
jgi:hypothetical protein